MTISLDDRLRAMVRGDPRERARRAVTLALAGALVVQAVRLTYAVITPVSPIGDWRPAMPVPLPADARSALFARLDPFYRQASVDPSATMAVTALTIQLFGVRTNAATGGGSAIIAGEDGVQTSIGTGEEIQPGVRLVGVHFDHVVIERGGVRELLYLDQGDAPATAAATAAGTATPSPVAPPGATPAPVVAPPAPISPSSIRAGIALAPRAINGRVTGIRVSQTGDGSAFAAVGFRDGDVIRSVNGRSVASAGDIAALTSRLQPGARLSLEVERGAGTAQIAVLIPNGTP